MNQIEAARQSFGAGLRLFKSEKNWRRFATMLRDYADLLEQSGDLTSSQSARTRARSLLEKLPQVFVHQGIVVEQARVPRSGY